MKRTTAQDSSGGMHVNRVPGVSNGTRDIAEDRNNLQEEICHPIELLGRPLDGTDQYQLEKAIIGLSKPVGEVFDLAIEQTPVAWGSARNNTNPSNPRYFPAVPLWDANHDLDPTNYPLLVPALRAQKAKAWTGAAFLTDHTVTVSGTTITGSGTAWDNLVGAIAEDALKLGSYQRTVNIGGTDYAITAATPASHTLTVTGSPATGSQTAIVYPYRIAGSTNARVFKDSGNAAMTPDGIRYVGGLQVRDRMQGHWHDMTYSGSTATLFQATTTGSSSTAYPGTASAAAWEVRSPKSDGSNGTPRTGPTTDPNASIRFRYLWAGVYV